MLINRYARRRMRHIHVANPRIHARSLHRPLHQPGNIHQLRPPPRLHPQRFHRLFSHKGSSLASAISMNLSALCVSALSFFFLFFLSFYSSLSLRLLCVLCVKFLPLPNRPQNKVVLITVAAQGLGFGCARQCAAEGAAVVLADIQKERGEQAATTLRDEGAQALFVPLDLRDESQCAPLIDQTICAHAKLDALP